MDKVCVILDLVLRETYLTAASLLLALLLAPLLRELNIFNFCSGHAALTSLAY